MNVKKHISAVFQLTVTLALVATSIGHAAAAPAPANSSDNSTQRATASVPPPSHTTEAAPNAPANVSVNVPANVPAKNSTVTRQQVIDELYAARKNGDIIRNEADYDVANFKTRHASK